MAAQRHVCSDQGRDQCSKGTTGWAGGINRGVELEPHALGAFLADLGRTSGLEGKVGPRGAPQGKIGEPGHGQYENALRSLIDTIIKLTVRYYGFPRS